MYSPTRPDRVVWVWAFFVGVSGNGYTTILLVGGNRNRIIRNK